jgi:signal transduction histidine kinase
VIRENSVVPGIHPCNNVTGPISYLVDFEGGWSFRKPQVTANQTNQNSPVFDLQVEGASRNLHPILRDDVYRIAGEAMRNAFLHAEASRIEVEIHYDEHQLRLRIRDDGKGIDPQFVAEKGGPGHWGLRGMRERAKPVGGNLGVWSKLDSSTEIELTIPGSTAYAAPTQRRSRLSRKGEVITD